MKIFKLLIAAIAIFSLSSCVDREDEKIINKYGEINENQSNNSLDVGTPIVVTPPK